MKPLLIAACAALLAAAGAAGAQTDPDAPRGKLPGTVVPAAYRLDMTILPDQPRFSGHAEIDVDVRTSAAHIYMDGRNLAVTRAVAMVAGRAIPATWTQVDPTGVVRLDFRQPLPAGRTTLVFDYSGAFQDSAVGLYRIQVGGVWYSWTQFESIDARSAFPSFDEPGFKTPFTISITTRPGFETISNARQSAVTPAAGGLETHRFEPTRPLPTYLVAMDTGPFLHPTSQVPADPQRATPLPLGVVATRAQAGKLDFVLAQTPPIVELLEAYFGQPFPFPKLDQIASPEMPGAMENAGADTYGDGIILLDRDATTSQKQEFGMVVGHELSHQWFGDLVSPAWWDDIWLNESFANWMGYRIGAEWRPDLKIGEGAIAEALGAMNTDALTVGRPIHQHIATNAEIDSAFDSITYGKGGQVVAMIAAYMGDDQFRAGVRLHLSRHMYGNADTDQFFQALADAAHDPRIVAAMRSFVDQQGVPLVTLARDDGGWRAEQSPYVFLGQAAPATRWVVPLCVRAGADKRCALLGETPTQLAGLGGGAIVPNAGGTGYYRFELPAADWDRLIDAFASLPAGEALAVDDSLWASFRAGRAPAAKLIAEARAALANPSADASLTPGERLAGLRLRGFVEGAAVADYRRLMRTLYGPKLAEVGFDPRAGAYASDAPDLQKLRQDLVGLVATEADDTEVQAKLATAAKAFLAGDHDALDQAFMGAAFGALVRVGGVEAARSVIEAALGSEDPVFRGAALGGTAASGRTDVANWLLGFADPRLRPVERLRIFGELAATAETRDLAADWMLANYDRLATGGFGIFVATQLPTALGAQCSAARADQIEQLLGAKIRAAGTGSLALDRTLEAIRHCSVLKAAREAQVAQALVQAR
jgi:aminopeptidase N